MAYWCTKQKCKLSIILHCDEMLIKNCRHVASYLKVGGQTHPKYFQKQKKKPRKTQKQTNPNKKNKTGNSKVLQILIRGGGVVRYGGISIIHFNFLYIIVGEQLYHIWIFCVLIVFAAKKRGGGAFCLPIDVTHFLHFLLRHNWLAVKHIYL